MAGKKSAPQPKAKMTGAKAVATPTPKMAKATAKAPGKSKIQADDDLDGLFTPLDDRLIVKVDVVSERTAGGIIIPNVEAADQPSQGLVLAVGRGHLGKKGRLQPMDVKVGDTILFANYGTQKIKMGIATALVMRETDILGILDK
jgi:chaperonin GroES